MINSKPDLTICGETDDCESAERLAIELKADVVVVDAMLKTGHGLDLIQTLSRNCPQIPALMLSMYDENVYAERALRVGARGYVMKNQAPATIIAAIRKVLAGEVYLSPKARERMQLAWNGATVFTDRITSRLGDGAPLSVRF